MSQPQPPSQSHSIAALTGECARAVECADHEQRSSRSRGSDSLNAADCLSRLASPSVCLSVRWQPLRMQMQAKVRVHRHSDASRAGQGSSGQELQRVCDQRRSRPPLCVGWSGSLRFAALQTPSTWLPCSATCSTSWQSMQTQRLQVRRRRNNGGQQETAGRDGRDGTTRRRRSLAD